MSDDARQRLEEIRDELREIRAGVDRLCDPNGGAR